MTAIARVAGPDGPRLLLHVDARHYDVGSIVATVGAPPPGDMAELLCNTAAVAALRAAATGPDAWSPLDQTEDELTFLPLVARPQKIICVGLNYRLHAAEGGVAVPAQPVLFAKYPNALVGHGAAIVRPRVTTQLDYEGELALIIRRRTSYVEVGDALASVGAYTILNDVSARDLQAAEPQWIRAKSLDTFAPIGPYAVIPDDGFDPASYRIRTTVSGERRQDASCGDMVFSVPEIIAFISEAITLEPGDIISTGTPPGVGLGFDPPRYLSAGDTVRIEIDGIGALVNTVVAA